METIREELKKMAEAQGFAHTAFLPVKDLVFVEEYRKYCADNLCGNYDKLPACPPKCGTVKEMRARAQQFDTAFVMQSIHTLDITDSKEIAAAKHMHNLMTRAVVEGARKLGVTGLVMSAGPTKDSSCMSAYCVDAGKMAESCGMEYWLTDGRVALFSQFLFNED